MKTDENNQEISIKGLHDQIKALTYRIAAIEHAIEGKPIIKSDTGFGFSHPDQLDQTKVKEKKEDGENWIESKLGEIGLGLLGNVVLLFCIIFLMTFTQNQGYRLLPTIIGFAAVAGVLILSFYNRESYPVLTRMLSICSQLLAYYVMLKLHFFVEEPLVKSAGLSVALLFLPIGFQLYYAVKNKLELVAGMAIFLIVITSLFYNNIHLSMALLVVAAGVTLYLLSRYSWWRFLIASIFLVYIAHALLIWDNPLMGGSGKLITSHQYNMVYLFIYGTIFSLTLVIKHKEPIMDAAFIAITLINAFWFSLVLIINILTYFPGNYVLMFILISFYCLVFSVLIRTRTNKLFAPAFYACFGFMALSVAEYGFFGFPDTYLLLTLQSLFVASWALWFRSKIIIVTNTFLFLGIMMTYLFLEESVSIINFTFAVVGLISARLLNWKKERLALKTEFLRNIYLFLALGMLLYAFYGYLPGQYISISWIAVAGLFFLMSVILRNVKYRWLGFGAILSTIVYLLFVDLAQMDIGYRIVVFLFLAVLSIGLSVYYTKRAKKKT